MLIWLMLFFLVLASIATITLLSVNFKKSKHTEIIIEGSTPNIAVESSKSLPPPTIINNIDTPPPIINVNNNVMMEEEEQSGRTRRTRRK